MSKNTWQSLAEKLYRKKKIDTTQTQNPTTYIYDQYESMLFMRFCTNSYNASGKQYMFLEVSEDKCYSSNLCSHFCQDCCTPSVDQLCLDVSHGTCYSVNQSFLAVQMCFPPSPQGTLCQTASHQQVHSSLQLHEM